VTNSEVPDLVHEILEEPLKAKASRPNHELEMATPLLAKSRALEASAAQAARPVGTFYKVRGSVMATV